MTDLHPPPPPLAHVRLREAIAAAGLDLRGASNELRCSVSHLSRVLRMETRPSDRLMARAAARFGVPVSEWWIADRERDAALHADRSPQELARVLGVEPRRFVRWLRGVPDVGIAAAVRGLLCS